MEIEIDTARLRRRFSAAPKKYQRIIRNAINDTLRETRAETPDLLKRVIRDPVPFTVRKTAAVYRGATYEQLSGTLSIAPAQARYLAPGEHGETSEHVIQPAKKWATDRHGNVLKKYRRFALDTGFLRSTTESKSDGSIGRFMIGKPRGRGNRPAGLYERVNFDSGLVLVTKFIRRRRYRAQFGIVPGWTKIATPRLQRNIAAQIKHPQNRI